VPVGPGSDIASKSGFFASLFEWEPREDDFLRQIEVGSGVIPGEGGSVYLPLLAGRSRALEIIASSEDYDADTAERYGWINRAIPDKELDDFC
jgi:enoyl-CoA hydratase/carnithine racemase